MKERIASLILAFWACWPLASYGDQNLHARFEKSLKDANSISNVELDWLDTFTVKDDPEALKALNVNEFSRTVQYSFIASGPKYYAACRLISGTKSDLTKLCESAFDGKSYATSTSDYHTMTIGSARSPAANSESDMNPLIAPFMFLTKESDDCNRCLLCFTDITSDEFANGLALPTGQKSDGVLEITIPGLPIAKQPTTWIISIDEAGDSFTPKTIKNIVPGNGYEVVNRFVDYTNLGSYQFPSRIEWTRIAYPPTSPPTLLSTGMVTLISARVPSEIVDSVFELDSEKKSASVIWDWDQRKLVKSAPELANVKTASKTARNVSLLLIVFTTGAFLVVVARRLASRSEPN